MLKVLCGISFDVIIKLQLPGFSLDLEFRIVGTFKQFPPNLEFTSWKFGLWRGVFFGITKYTNTCRSIHVVLLFNNCIVWG